MRKSKGKAVVRERSSTKGKSPAEERAWIAPLRFGGEDFLVVSTPVPSPASGASLSNAEREVVALVVEGLSNAEIAERRGTSARTVANQLAQIFRKTGVTSRTDLAVRSLQSAIRGDERSEDEP